MQTQYEQLTDLQWEIIKKSLPIQRKRKHHLGDVVDGIFWVLRTGSQWRNLSEKFPKWQSVYYYFRKWQRNGLLFGLNWKLNTLLREQQSKEPSPSAVAIDSQSVKKAPFVEDQTGIDGNKKVNGRKRHILTDTLGLVWIAVVHAANLHDGVMAQKVVEPILGYLHRLKKVYADQAYKVDLGNWLDGLSAGIELEIASKPPSSKGFVPVKVRWVAEQTFGIFNFQRRLDKDHEKTTNSAQAWIYWANCQRILNRIDVRPNEKF